MRHLKLFIACWLCATVAASSQAADKIHLMILSGQSNMAGLNPAISFTPTVTKGLAGDEVIVVKSARGGQPIRRWYKKWKPEVGEAPKDNGNLYARLLAAVNSAIKGKQLTTITFVWMQGERDAKEKHGNVYAASLKGLIDQLKEDLKRDDINFVIGRLSDFDSEKKSIPHWEVVRAAQVKVAEADKRGAWVDTDDLNGPKNGLHYNKDGYKELGKRFAEKAIELIKSQQTSKK